MSRKFTRSLISGIACLLLAACGGGGPAVDGQASTNPTLLGSGTTVVPQVSSQPGNAASEAAASTSDAAPQSFHRFDPTKARFNGPQGIALHFNGDLYVADSLNYTIRKISRNGSVTTVAGMAGMQGSADGRGSAARFTDPKAVAVDWFGTVYVADGSAIRKITPAGDVTTLAGVQGLYGEDDGVGSAARFRSPTGIAVDSMRNVFVVDPFDFLRRVRKIAPDGTVSTFAGGNQNATQIPQDGVGTQAAFIGPTGLAIDYANNLYVTDIGLGGITVSNFHDGATFVRKVTPGAAVTTVVGNLGFTSLPAGGPLATFSYSHGIAVRTGGSIFVTDHFNQGNRVKSVPPSGSPVTTQPLDESKFASLSHLAIGWNGVLYASDKENHTIFRIQGGNVTVYAGATGIPGSVDVP